jgi:hypothetical protein
MIDRVGVAMSCPPELVELIGEMTQRGFLRIRAYAWNGSPSECAAEADHLHNLPYLLIDYRPELLVFYWDVERPCYVSRNPAALRSADWQRLWEKLAPMVARARSSLLASETPGSRTESRP